MKSTSRLSAAEFKAYYSSYHWSKKRREALDHYGRQCAVCGDDYKRRTKVGRAWRLLRWIHRLLGGEIRDQSHLTVHHCQYVRDGQPVFHREDVQLDLAVLCWKHHPKGPLSKAAIRRWRTSYRWRMWFLSFIRHVPGPR